MVSKEKSELEGLIAQKNAELQTKLAQANSFNGRNPLTQGVQDYKDGLAQNSANSPELTQQAHEKWEHAYSAAHEARILSESIKTLGDKSRALSAYHAEQAVRWREIDALHESRRQYAERREEQIKHKTRVDEESRRELVKAANTLQAPAATMATGAVVWGRTGVLVAEGAAAALGLDIDHIVSKQALKRHIVRVYPEMPGKMLEGYLARGPSIAIPHEVHRRFSETYKGRNTKEKQAQDAKDLRAAVNSNFDAIKTGLLEMGFEEAQIEKAREELHELNKEQGWYE
ncbi:hypothetical protein [Pseudomonas syringae]|uniref:Uncharacterized protein n=1 Tax=Pseudomonas syringae TaxID=317 RepID=A0A085VR57_PSESX|nr:hypothetical protein [Pseudomonas syringae]KFE57920.1 hypothetical protein IV01_00960 [Pseudomonas syringae]